MTPADVICEGFSHLHDSGTGGSVSLGSFPLFPQVCVSDEIDTCKWNKIDRAVDRVNGSVVARPGYFAVTLNTTVSGNQQARKAQSGSIVTKKPALHSAG